MEGGLAASGIPRTEGRGPPPHPDYWRGESLQFEEGESRVLSAPSSYRCLEPTGIGRLSPSCPDDWSDQGQVPLSSASATPSSWLWDWPRAATLPTPHAFHPQPWRGETVLPRS